MSNKKLYHPRLVAVADKNGDALLTPSAAWERLREERRERDAHCFRAPKLVQDFVEPRRPVDAPMATRLDDVVEPVGVGRLILILLLMASSFIAGMVVGRLA